MSNRKPYTPTVQGRASICTWSLKFYFFEREQALKAVNKILKKYSYIDIHIETQTVENRDATIVEIVNMSWANNLKYIARLIESCDYYSG